MHSVEFLLHTETTSVSSRTEIEFTLKVKEFTSCGANPYLS